jgi:hypothetical protein
MLMLPICTGTRLTTDGSVAGTPDLATRDPGAPINMTPLRSNPELPSHVLASVNLAMPARALRAKQQSR